MKCRNKKNYSLFNSNSHPKQQKVIMKGEIFYREMLRSLKMKNIFSLNRVTVDGGITNVETLIVYQNKKSSIH